MNWQILSVLQLILAPYLLLQKLRRFRRRGEKLEWDKARWTADFARIEPQGKPHLILVAMGFAEARMAGEVARGLRERCPNVEISIAVVNCEAARRGGSARTERIYPAPFDCAPCVARWSARAQPTHIVFVERFLWTIWVPMLAERGVKIGAISAYLRPKSKLRGWGQKLQYRAAWRALQLLCLRSPEQENAVRPFVADSTRVVTTGSLKFMPQIPRMEAEREEQLHRWISQVGERPLLAAGSTQPGDEDWILPAFAPLKARFGAALLLAPRNASRADAVEEQCRAQGLSVARRSRFAPRSEQENCGNSDGETPDVLLLDTVGELVSAYEFCVAAFVGGTITGNGGHNVLEPVAQLKPVFFGPQRGHFAQEQADCEAAGVGFRVQSSAELERGWAQFLESSTLQSQCAERARQLNARGQSNWLNTLDELENFLR